MFCSDVISPEVFEEFYNCWKESEVKALEATNHSTAHLLPEENVIKMSEIVRCSMGSGRIGLTQKR